MPHPFDLHCKNHPEREIDDRARPDRLCTECYLSACNAGASIADAQWANTPQMHASHERAPDGRRLDTDYSLDALKRSWRAL